MMAWTGLRALVRMHGTAGAAVALVVTIIVSTPLSGATGPVAPARRALATSVERSFVVATQQPASAPQDEFVPVSALPPQEQLPAAPLLVAAYAVVWVMVLLYLFSLWRRLNIVERELSSVARRVEQERGK